MTAAYPIQVNGRSYTVVDDCTSAYLAVIMGAVTDEVFVEFSAPGLAVEVMRNDLATKTTQNGLYAVTGYPRQSFPQLNSTSYAVNFVLTAPGFRDYPLSVTIPTNATFPVAAPPVAMRRLPVRIQGRVVNMKTMKPEPGATIVSMDDPLAAAPPTVHTTALRSPLYNAHASGAPVQSVTVTTALSPSLTQDANAGVTVLNLSDRTGLAANSIVRLSNSLKTLMEYAVVDHLGPGAVNAPGQAFLRNALNRTYVAASTTVEFMTLDITPGVPPTLLTDANAGDGILLATQLFTGTVVVESGSAMVAEYHEVGAVSDADGYYGLDGMGRVQEIFLQASQGALNQTVGWFLEYDRPVNLVDFRIQ